MSSERTMTVTAYAMNAGFAARVGIGVSLPPPQSPEPRIRYTRARAANRVARRQRALRAAARRRRGGVPGAREGAELGADPGCARVRRIASDRGGSRAGHMDGGHRG